MGHAIFVLLHLMAIVFLGVGLLVLTIPLHLIYAVVSGIRGGRAPREDQRPTKICPACAETVLQSALKCKHCGHRIVMDEVRQAVRANESDRKSNTAIELLGTDDHQATLSAIHEARAAVAPGSAFTARVAPEPCLYPDQINVEIAGYVVGRLNCSPKRFEKVGRKYFGKPEFGGMTATADVSPGPPLRVHLYLEEELAAMLARE